MGLFTSKSSSKSKTRIDPKDMYGPWGTIMGDTSSMTTTLSPELQMLADSFGLFSQSQMDQLNAFDQEGFTESTLAMLRERARQAEAMQAQSSIASLFNTGKLGRSINTTGLGGENIAIQPELMQMQEALARADLDRQLTAIGLGNEQAANMLALAHGGQAGQANIQSLLNPYMTASLQGANQYSKSSSKSTPSIASQIASIAGGFMTGGMSTALGGMGSLMGQGYSPMQALQNTFAAPIAQAGGPLMGTPGSWAGPRL